MLRVLSIQTLSWGALPFSEVGKEMGGDAGPDPEYSTNVLVGFASLRGGKGVERM